MRAGGRTIRLRRYSVDGVVWGRETVWLDDAGRFAAIVTRVHILPLEGVRDDLKEALPALQQAAVRDRMADLAAWRKRTVPVAEGRYAITGARLIDGAGGAPIDNGVMVVNAGRITAIGPRGGVAIPAASAPSMRAAPRSSPGCGTCTGTPARSSGRPRISRPA